MQGLGGAPVYMLEREIRNSRDVWGNPDPAMFIEHLASNGMDRSLAQRAAAKMRAGLTLPEKILPLRSGEEMFLDGGIARVVHAPGHADHQLMLHNEERKILFAADHVLLRITPNIGLWPESEPNPLARYLSSLQSMRDLPVDLVLPGHGPLFHDLKGRIDELSRHHEERLDLMLREIDGAPRTPFEVSRKVFRYGLSLYEQCFALSETLAHLEHLVHEGRAERMENGIFSFRAA